MTKIIKEATNTKRVLCVRMDRIGDLVLTMPVDQLPALKKSAVTWMIPRFLSFVPRLATPARRYVEWELKFSWPSFLELLSWLKRNPVDMAIVFHAPWWVSFALWVTRVPVRVGVRSQWHSFLFLNRSVRQKRSQALYHELIYNQMLAQEGLGLIPQETLQVPPLQLRHPVAEEVLQQHGLREKNYVVIHPGMGGSARNWSTENYAKLICKLSLTKQVVITGSVSDHVYLEPIWKLLKEANEENIIWLNEKLSGHDLVAVLQNAQVVLAPSTGVIHLAASTGVSTFGIYSPVRVQAAKRWGPIGVKVATWVPEVDCPGEKKCLMEQCSLFDCMTMITVESLLQALQK